MNRARIHATVLMSLLILTSTQVMAQDPNDPPDPNVLPDDFPEFIITQLGDTAPGYLMGSVQSNNDEVGSYFMIMDNAGVPIFYSKTQSLGGLVCNGLFEYRTEIPGMRKKYTWHLQDENFNDVDSFQMGNGYIADNHDFQLLPNGHVLMLCYSSHIIDMSQIVEGGHPTANITGAVIQELDVHKNVIFQWRSIDHIPITDSYRRLDRASIAYIHVNSIELDETDGNIILSCRETSEVIKISRVTGEVMWRMGAKNNEFTFINEHPETAPRHFKLTHDARRHANGHLTIFDNGADKNDMERTYSRAVEYDLDEENKTATMVWEYRNDPDFLALSGGNCTRLSNGNTIIRWGGAAKAGEAPAMTEADPNGQLVYEIWPAQEDVTGGFNRIVWPLEDLTTTVTRYEVDIGNTYIFAEGYYANTGVSIRIDDITGDIYNGMMVKRVPFAPLYPHFSGKAPRVLSVRVYVSGASISSINARISFDTENFGLTNPDALTIHHRETVGQGVFIPLETSYNYVTGKLRATMTSFGEFIFCFSDLEEVAYTPILIEPQHQSSVNQELPASFFWTPRGFGRSYHLQVATDAQFDTLVVDDPNIIETRYVLEDVKPDMRHYWRVSTSNEGGTSEWSEEWFDAVPPTVEVTVPNGGEQWQRGLSYFIRWDDNLAEDVVIELYKDDSLLQTIDTVTSIGAYEWEVDLELETGSDYSIKITSVADEIPFDVSDAAFTIE